MAPKRRNWAGFLLAGPAKAPFEGRVGRVRAPDSSAGASRNGFPLDEAGCPFWPREKIFLASCSLFAGQLRVVRQAWHRSPRAPASWSARRPAQEILFIQSGFEEHFGNLGFKGLADALDSWRRFLNFAARIEFQDGKRKLATAGLPRPRDAASPRTDFRRFPCKLAAGSATSRECAGGPQGSAARLCA